MRTDRVTNRHNLQVVVRLALAIGLLGTIAGGCGRRTADARVGEPGTRAISEPSSEIAAARSLAWEVEGDRGRVEAQLLEPRAVAVTVLESGESRVWDMRTSERIATLTPPSDPRDRPESFEISPDGSRIVAIVGDELRVWPLERDAEATTLVDGRPDLVGVRWRGDAEHLVVWTETSVGTIDLRGAWTQGPWPAKRVRWVEPSLDARRAHVREGSGASVVDLATGNVLVRVAGMSRVGDSTLRGDGRRWLTAAADACTLWDVDAGKALATLRNGATRCDVQGFSTDGRLAIIEASDDRATLLDAETGAVVRRLPRGLRFAASDGARVVAAGEHRVVVLEVATGRELSAFDLEGVTRLWLAAGGRRVIARRHDRQDELSLWALDPTPRLLKSWRDGTDAWIELAASGTEALAHGRAARLVDLQTAKSGPVVGGDLTKPIAVSWSPDGRALVTRADDRALVFAASDGRLLGECSPGGERRIDDAFFVDSADHVGVLSAPTLSICAVGPQAKPRDCGIGVDSAVAVSPRGRVAVLGSRGDRDVSDASAEVFVVPAKRPAIAHGDAFLPTTLAWVPDREAWLVGQSQRGPVWLEGGKTRPFGPDVRPGDESSEELRSDAVAVAHDGSFAVTAGPAGGVWLLDPRSGGVLATLWPRDPERWEEDHGASPFTLELAPDSSHVAFIDVDRNLRVFDVAARTAVLELSATDAPVAAIAWSPEPRRLAVARHVACRERPHRDAEACKEGSWHQIEIREGDGLAVVERIDAHRGTITDLAFSPDGRSLASTGADQALRVWSISPRATPPPPRR